MAGPVATTTYPPILASEWRTTGGGRSRRRCLRRLRFERIELPRAPGGFGQRDGPASLVERWQRGASNVSADDAEVTHRRSIETTRGR